MIELTEGMTVYADIPEHFVLSNRRDSFTLTPHSVVLDKTFGYLLGEYVVYATKVDGGGHSLGQSGHGYYPDEYHVFCYKKTTALSI